MKVYHLELEVMYGESENTFYSNVYLTYEKAVEEGKYNLQKMLQNIYDNKNLTIDEIVNIEEVDYIFTVTEIEDLEYTENFDIDLTTAEKYLEQNIKPTHIIYTLDYKGDLIYKTIQ